MKRVFVFQDFKSQKFWSIEVVGTDITVNYGKDVYKRQDLLKKEKLWVNEGSLYGETGEGFIRINIACPRQRLIEGLNRLKRVLKS